MMITYCTDTLFGRTGHHAPTNVLSFLRGIAIPCDAAFTRRAQLWNVRT